MIELIGFIAAAAAFAGLLYWAADSDEEPNRLQQSRVREEAAAKAWAEKNERHREE